MLDEGTSDSDTSVPDQKDSTSSEGGSTQTNQTTNEENTTQNAKMQDESATQEETSSEISVQTTAFSFYVVRFSYETKTYDVCAGETIPLATILSSVNLSGTPSAVTTNDADHITLTQEDSSWNVTAQSNILSDAKITVTISDVDYDISITLTDSYDFFALLFEDGTLAFVNKDHDAKPLEETYGAVLHTYPAPEDGSMHGWSENDAVKHVVFLDPYAPKSLADYFYGCSSLIDFSCTNLDTSACTSMYKMFSGCIKIKELDLSSLTVKDCNIGAMFFICPNLKYLNISNWTIEDYAGIFDACENLVRLDMNNCTFENCNGFSSYSCLTHCSKLAKINAENSTTSGKSLEGFLANITASEINLNGLYGPNVTTIERMFNTDTNLKTISIYMYLPELTNVCSAFSACASLENININIAGYPRIQETNDMFYSCFSLRSITWQNAVACSVKTFTNIFRNCGTRDKTINLDGWRFEGNNLDALASYMNFPTIGQISFSMCNWTTVGGSLTSMACMFGYHSNISSIKLNGWTGARADTVTNFSAMFQNCTNLTSVEINGLLSPDYLCTVTFDGMFNGTSSLRSVDISCLENVKSVRSMQGMFAGSGITELTMNNVKIDESASSDALSGCFAADNLKKATISGWDIPIDINTQGYSLFGSAKSLNYIIADDWNIPNKTSLQYQWISMNYTKQISIQNWNCPNVTDISMMFAGDHDLADILWGNWSCGKINDMHGIFQQSGLSRINFEELPFDVGEVEDLNCFACQMPNLTEINFSNNAFGHVTNLAMAFNSTPKLSILNLKNFDTENVEHFDSWMKDSGIRKLILGPKVSFAKGGDTDCFPQKTWKNVETGKSYNLWTEYNGSTMSGTYVADSSMILSTDMFDSIEYNNDTKHITFIQKPENQYGPAAITIPDLTATQYELTSYLVRGNKALRQMLDSSFMETNITASICVKTRLYNSNCSSEKNTIWTFNVPKDNTKIIRINVRYPYGNAKLFGYITNDQDDKDVFVFYDADGKQKEILSPGKQHTYRDLGYIGSHDTIVTNKDGTKQTVHEDYTRYGSLKMTDDKLDSTIYPSYDKYISYNQEMNNYEVVMPPNGWAIEIVSNKNIRLTPKKITTTIVRSYDSDGTMEEIEVPDKYIYSVENPDACEGVGFTIGNKIDSKPITITRNQSSIQITYIKKVTPDGPMSEAVSGAKYAFWDKNEYSAGHTDVKYAKYIGTTNKNGLVTYSNADYNRDYVAREISAPKGLKINNDVINIRPLLYDWRESTTETVEITYEDAALSSYRSGDCNACMTPTDSLACTCKIFGNCICKCCGNRTIHNEPTSSYITTQDEKYSVIDLYKKDDNTFSNFDKSKILFRFVLKDMNTSETKEIYLRDFQESDLSAADFLIEGHTYQITEESYKPNSYTPINNKIGISGTNDGTEYEFSTGINTVDFPYPYTITGKTIEFYYSDAITQNGTINFINHKNINTRELSVSKTIDTSHSTASTANEDFHFTLSLSNETLDSLANQKITFAKTDGATGDVTLTDGKYEFTLKGGEKITFSGIPDHTAYTVEEADSPQYLSRSENATGTIYGENANVTFTNEKVDLPFMPNTGGVGRSGIYGTACIIGITSALIYTKKRRRRL